MLAIINSFINLYKNIHKIWGPNKANMQSICNMHLH